MTSQRRKDIHREYEQKADQQDQPPPGVENVPNLSDMVQKDAEPIHHDTRTPGSGAMSGMKPQRKDFEHRTYDMAVGSETPDGSLEKLELHHDHGKEGVGSKADEQFEHEVLHHPTTANPKA